MAEKIEEGDLVAAGLGGDTRIGVFGPEGAPGRFVVEYFDRGYRCCDVFEVKDITLIAKKSPWRVGDFLQTSGGNNVLHGVVVAVVIGSLIYCEVDSRGLTVDGSKNFVPETAALPWATRWRLPGEAFASLRSRRDEMPRGFEEANEPPPAPAPEPQTACPPPPEPSFIELAFALFVTEPAVIEHCTRMGEAAVPGAAPDHVKLDAALRRAWELGSLAGCPKEVTWREAAAKRAAEMVLWHTVLATKSL